MAGHSAPGHSVDVLRKSFIVTLLFAAMILLFRFAIPDEHFDPTGMLALGFVVLAAYTIGELAEVVKLPHITGYLIAGLLLGESTAKALKAWPALTPYLLPPFDKGILSGDILQQLDLLNTLALALICLTAGGELRIEGLRKGLVQILGILGTQTVTIFAGVTALTVAISGVFPGLAYANFEGLTVAQAASVGLVLSSISLATAPAATIAVINSTRARGPMTSNILSVVVLKDVVVVLVFALANLAAVTALGAGEAQGLGAALWHIALSLALGAAVGWGIKLYLQFINAEILVFLVGLIYTTAFVAEQLHGEVALVFIAAGFVVANFSNLGDRLIHEVERLSMPVYVVFFTMAGAGLHLDAVASVATYAILFVLMRVAMVWIGVRIGAQATQADENTRTYGWMGFLSQAGLAITLAGQLKSTYTGEIGEGLYSLVLAGVAINEVIGPILLQMGIGLAGEDGNLDEDEEEQSLDPVARERWDATEDPDLWGPPAETASEDLNNLTVDLQQELQALARDLSRGPIEEAIDDAEEYLRTLRREFLRYHRRATVRVQSEPEQACYMLRSELGELAERWRDHVLDRGAQVASARWTPIALTESLEDLMVGLPENEILPLHPDSLRPREEPVTLRARRALLRLQHRFRPVERPINVRNLARFHITGRAVGRLEGLPALLIHAELCLADRTADLFDALAAAYSQTSRLEDTDASSVGALLVGIRRELDEAFEEAITEQRETLRDGARRTSTILAVALRSFNEDLNRIGTLDLPNRKRRFSLVYSEKNAGLHAMGPGLLQARKTVGARYAGLGLAFEVVGLEGRVREAVSEHGSYLERQIAGRGLTQVHRVLDNADEARGHIREILNSELSGEQMAEALVQQLQPCHRLTEEVAKNAMELRDWLGNEVSDTPLLDALLRSAQTLTEWYEVPLGRPEQGEWKLPTAVGRAELPFREIAVGFIEANVTRDLIDVTRRLAVKVDQMVAVIEELERLQAFQLDLVQGELAAQGDEPPLPESLNLAKEALLSSTDRVLRRLRRLEEEAASWGEEARRGVEDAVLDKLAQFRSQVFNGELHQFRGLRSTDVRNLVDRAKGISSDFRRVRSEWLEWLLRAAGEERLASLRENLGLPDLDGDRLLPRHFAAPAPIEDLPVVYRRLFSDQAIEAGDLLTGRQDELQQAAEVLQAGVGTLRTVALVGEDAIGQAALVGAIRRAVRHRKSVRHRVTEPTTSETVRSWFEGPDNRLLIIEGLQWLYERRPGGQEPLETLIGELVQARGRNAVVLVASSGVWQGACQVSDLGRAVADVVSLQPLSAEELEQALMARHAMSGYDLHFQTEDDLAWRLQHLLTRRLEGAERVQHAWFRTLHAAANGVMHDALSLWMAAIASVDESEGQLVVGPVQRPPLTRLRRLDDEAWLALRQVVLQGYITTSMMAQGFGISAGQAQTRLSSLEHLGILDQDQGIYVIADHLRGSVYQVLHERRWL